MLPIANLVVALAPAVVPAPSAPAPTRVDAGPFAAGAVAPPLDGVTWADAAKGADTIERVTTTSSSDARVRSPQGDGYPAWYGFTVLALQLPAGAPREVVELGELLQRANADRGLVVVTLERAAAPPVEAAGAGDAAEEPKPEEQDEATPPPSAALRAAYAPEASPWCPDAVPRAFVLGPTGEVVGAVRLPAERDALLALIEGALLRYPAAPLAEDLGAAVREPQGLYFEGQWEAARKLAQKLVKRLERGDPDGARAATALVAHIDGFERDVRAALIDANRGMHSAERLATVVAAIRRGFPRGAARDDAEAAADLQRKDLGREAAYRISEEWVEALPQRPACFPEVADARGRKYAKALEALTRRENFDGDLTRHARTLLLRFELADRR